MDMVGLVGRLALGLVLGIAGAMKLANPVADGDVLTALGIRGAAARGIDRVLPWVELSVALALVWPPTAGLATVAATALFGAFAIVVGMLVLRGQAPPCNCFGAVSAAPVGRATLARNIALTAVAAATVPGALARQPASLESLRASADGTGTLLVLALLTLVLFVSAVMSLRAVRREQQELRDSILLMERMVDQQVVRKPPAEAAVAPDPGLPAGALVPVAAPQAGVDPGVAALLARGLPMVLVHVSDSCAPCRALAPKLQSWAAQYADLVTFAVITDLGAEAKYGANVSVLRQKGQVLSEAFRLKWTPGAVVVGIDGRVAGPVAYGEEQIESVVTTLLIGLNRGLPAIAALAKVEDGAPGVGADMSDVRRPANGKPELLLFWQNDCHYCQGIADAVRAWAALPAPRPGGADLVVVNWSRLDGPSFDGVDVIHDRDGALARRFGAKGTPSAVLLDEHGRVAAPVVAGGPATLALLGVPVPA